VNLSIGDDTLTDSGTTFSLTLPAVRELLTEKIKIQFSNIHNFHTLNGVSLYYANNEYTLLPRLQPQLIGYSPVYAVAGDIYTIELNRNILNLFSALVHGP